MLMLRCILLLLIHLSPPNSIAIRYPTTSDQYHHVRHMAKQHQGKALAQDYVYVSPSPAIWRDDGARGAYFPTSNRQV